MVTVISRWRSIHLFALASLLLASVGLLAAQARQRPAQQRPDPPPPPLEKLKVPAGFKIDVYAEGVTSARQMAIGPKGTLFVGSRAGGRVYAITDADGDHKADSVKVVASGLTSPSGVAFRDGSLYVGAISRVLRYDDIESKLDAPPAAVVLTDALPTATHHGFKFIAFGPDGLLYVPVGGPCNVCERLDDPRFATILRMKPDGSNIEVFASGIRNTVGFDWHPTTKELWFTDNGRDEMGDDVPNDELNVATQAGQHFGFPYCHQGNVPDPDFGAKRPCADFVPPAQLMGPHVAAVGMTFYTETMFPAAYQNTVFIAQHGSWNRSVPLGYRVMAAKVEGSKVVSYEPFVVGFMQGIRSTSPRGATADTFARPASVLVMPDGSLLISDDQQGRIYRVSYAK